VERPERYIEALVNPIDLANHLIDAHRFEVVTVDSLDSDDLRTVHWEDHATNAYGHHHRPEAVAQRLTSAHDQPIEDRRFVEGAQHDPLDGQTEYPRPSREVVKAKTTGSTDSPPE
jgi:hypothetical protein